MTTGLLSILFLAGVAVGQGPAGQGDYYTAATGAARELSRSLDLLQRSFVNVPGSAEGRGLYQQLDPIQINLIYFRQQIQRKINRDDLYVAFDKVDRALTELLGDLQDLSKWDASVAMAMRRVRAAQHDVHFALSAGDAAPARQSDTAYRQTLALSARLEDLQNLVRYVFTEQPPLPDWNAGFKDLRSALADLQQLQKNKAGRDEVRQQMRRVDQAWEKLVNRYRDLPTSQNLLLRADFGQVDQVFARLAGMLGIDDRRAPLKNDDD